MDIISFLFPEDKKPEETTKTELETTLETAKELSAKLGFSTTEILHKYPVSVKLSHFSAEI